jgi:ssRNA-specific RNase YbeY (16S rRNA maturation enzyme)
MEIRRRDNPAKVMSLAINSVRTEQGWLVPIFPEMADDLFICYSNQEWELVEQKKYDLSEHLPVFG